jgi:hypothetical protein
MRVLDVDLDFFLHDVAYYMEFEGDRLDYEDYPVWSTAAPKR